MATATNVQAWSTTAADNDDADSSINWVEGQDPGTVNNSARAMMVAIRKFASDIGGGVTVGGTADAITITTGQDISAAHEAAGFSLRFKAGGTNTGAVTVNVDGEGTEAVERMDGTALQAGDIISGGIYDIAYNATNGGYTLLGAGQFQVADADLTAIAALAKTDGNIIVGDGSTWVAESGATARTSLGLGTGDSPQFTAVNIGAATDTTITRVSAGVIAVEGATVRTGTVAVANGGTGATTAQAAADAIVGASVTTDGFTHVTIRNSGVSGIASNLATILTLLNAVGTTKGNILYHTGTQWSVLAPP